jgi:tetratricopeptide (TPR) repeat protein
MKKLLFLCLVSISCSGNTTQVNSAKAIEYNVAVESINNPSIIDGIQAKINEAFVQSIMIRKDDMLAHLSRDLETLHKEKNQNLILYWRSYLQFYYSIYYLQLENNRQAEKEIDKGIDWLKGMQNKNSEDYALLSMLQGFALQFKGMKVMFISGEVKASAKQAISMDSTNIRGYYVYGSSDFYTPEKYGGGTEAEEYLLKALRLPTQKTTNTYLPSWGRQEAYELLIKFYIRKENWENAKKHFQMAIKEFPNNHQINKLAAKLVGK